MLNSYGRTALIHAVAKNNEDIVRLLISNGATVNAQDPTKLTPLMLAVRKGNINIVITHQQAGGLMVGEQPLGLP